MPAVLSYPGVYVEELSSGVRTITGVATSITAFVGRALRGPTDDEDQSPVRIFSFSDYQRVFGGLSVDCPMSFSVYQYFQNGGSDALIVRVHEGAKKAQIPGSGPVLFTAANPGTWGNSLRIQVDHAIDPELAALPGGDKLFNLRVKDTSTGVTETFLNVSIDAAHPRFVTQVLRSQSQLLRGVDTYSGLPAARLFDDANAQLEDGSDGSEISDTTVNFSAAPKRGFFALDKADLFNLLVIPPLSPSKDVAPSTWQAAVAYCKNRRAFALVDPPRQSSGWFASGDVTASGAVAAVAGRSDGSALFFPYILAPNPLREGRPEAFAPCGAVAGVMARTDAQRGVWKSAAGIDAALVGVLGPEIGLTDQENGAINILGVNCIRNFPNTGTVVWGARTLRGSDALASEWKYIAVRRLALYLEESLFRGTQWVVFEPNDEPLWAQIRLNLGAFMHSLFTRGAFQGKSAREAYFVKCDSETTSQTDINNGIVNIVVGFAPLKPAEFVVLKFQQIAGDIPT